MTDTATPRLALPLLAPGQAQKEMSHNEALTLIDIAVHGNIASAAALDSPPEEFEAGQCWIVGSDPEGAWAGHAGAIAGWTAGGWRFVAPREGMRLWIDSEHGFAFYSNGIWINGRVWGRLHVGGIQVVGAQQESIAEPTGGTTVDAPARAAIGEILEAMRAHGLIATTSL